MQNQNFTSLVEEKLMLLEMPEVIQQIVVQDLAEIILKRTYAELIFKLEDKDAEHVSKLLDGDNFNDAYTTIIEIPGAEEMATALTENILADFTEQMKEAV